MPPKQLAEIALEEIQRRLDDYETARRLMLEYATALTRASKLIDFATNAEINPKGYEGEIRELLHDHQEWIEKQRASGLFPRLRGTKAPVARPKRKSPK